MSTAQTSPIVAGIASTLATLHAAGDTWEIRAPRTDHRGTVSGYYSDPAACGKDVAATLDGKAPAVYVTLNPVKPDVAARAHHRLKDRAEVTTQDSEIVRRCWLPLDFDPVRPTGISSTDAEHDAALARAEDVAATLAVLGWPEPVRGDSGNGAHLLFRIDLPNDEESRRLIEQVLRALSAAFADPADRAVRVAIDTSVGNAARIWKLYPTWVRKGDSLPERPHRRSELLAAPDPVEIVSREQLVELCEQLQAPEGAPGHNGAHPASGHGPRWVADAGAYLREHGVAALERPAANATKWVLDACVWNPDHTDHSAWVMQFASGAIAAGCSHHSCQGKGWVDFRDAVEPGWRDGRPSRHELTALPRAEQEPDSGQEEDTPIPRSHEEVMAFPLHVLPPALQAYIKTVAAAVSCAPDLVAVPVLVTAGAAIGNSVVLEVKPGWRERACLWALVVARSGDGKSPAHDHAVGPLQRRQSQLHAEYRDALERWHEQKSREESAGPKPRAEHAAITDSTLEALANALLASPRGLLMALDEATAWVLSFNQYRHKGHGADRPHWLKIWSSEPTTAIRVTREEPVHLPASFVAVTGNIPPDKLTILGDEEGREDGFLARLLFTYPVPIPAQATEHGIPVEMTEEWEAVVGKLLQLMPQAPGDGQRGVPMLPAVAHFTAEGRRAWYDWLEQHTDEMNGDTFPDTLRAPWSKFKSYAARLALIVQGCRWACGEPAVTAFDVDAKSVDAATSLIAYFKAHCRRAYAFLHANPATREALGALEWMRRHRKRSVTGRDVARAHLRGLADSLSIEQALKTLARMGYGTVESKTVSGGRQVKFTRGGEA